MEIKTDVNYEILFKPNKYRHILFHGGRGGGKSYHVALAELLNARQIMEYSILCVREVQNSIKESVYSLLVELIKKYNFTDFKYTREEIRNTRTNSRYAFKGLKHNLHDVKSFQGFKKCWVEEAQALSLESLKMLIPTIRADGSQMIYTLNRFVDNDPVWELIGKHSDDPDIYVKKINMMDLDSDFQSKVLIDEMNRDQINDYNSYLHTWEGEPLGQDANSVISRIKIIEAMNRTIDNPEGGEVVGADIARFGDDLITFYKRKGFKIIDHQTFNKQDIVKTANDLMHFAGNKETLINIDDTGVGGGVTDILTNKGYNAVGVNFGARDHLSDDELDKYDNNITKMWIEFAGIIDKVDIPNDEDLKTELSTRLYTYTKDQKKVIEPKKDFKKRYGKSPDKADGLLLCYMTPKPRKETRLRTLG